MGGQKFTVFGVYVHARTGKHTWTMVKNSLDTMKSTFGEDAVWIVGGDFNQDEPNARRYLGDLALTKQLPPYFITREQAGKASRLDILAINAFGDSSVLNPMSMKDL